MIRGAILETLLTVGPLILAWVWYVGRTGYRDSRKARRRTR